MDPVRNSHSNKKQKNRLVRNVSNGVEARHDTVLLDETVEALKVQPTSTVVDATLGGAGHFSLILSTLGEGGTIVGIDADAAAIERAKAAYENDSRSRKSRPMAHFVHDNFRNLSHILAELGIDVVDAIVFDLGWSGYQIASPRGFSFLGDEPLLMTYGEGGETAAEIVNSSSESALADLIYTYGEERFARSIARAIVEARAKERILTTGALVAAINEGTPSSYQKGKLHPATKTFQALRIAVNDELGSLKEAIASALNVLTPGGKLAVITFHSIEDRIVKNMLRDAVQAKQGVLMPKKPITPSRSELLQNRRARSAKLRVFERSPFAYA